MKSIAGIYEIKCTVNNKKYIGESGCIKNRIKSHFSNLKNKSHQIESLQRDFIKYGRKKFRVKILGDYNLYIRLKRWYGSNSHNHYRVILCQKFHHFYTLSYQQPVLL